MEYQYIRSLQSYSIHDNNLKHNTKYTLELLSKTLNYLENLWQDLQMAV
jgi:hypothetical protein